MGSPLPWGNQDPGPISFTKEKAWEAWLPLLTWSEVKVAQSYPTLCDSMDLVHGLLQARMLEWVAFPFFRWSSQPRDRTQVSCIAGRFFISWATRPAILKCLLSLLPWLSGACASYPWISLPSGFSLGKSNKLQHQESVRMRESERL